MSYKFVTQTSITTLPRFAVYDFLAPSLVQPSRIPRSFRSISSTTRCRATTGRPGPNSPSLDESEKQSNSSSRDGSKTSPPTKPLTKAQRDFLSSALRVNQAGELAATLIYTAQTPPIVNSHPHLRPLMKHMYDQEEGHFKTFNSLIAKHRVRPTAMYPVWTLASSVLGWGTAIMGREAAMACTEAVETAIGGHYNEQVKELLDMADEMEKTGNELGGDLKEMISTIRRIRDEELEHLDIAVDNDAKEARPYELLTGVIKSGCRGAIWVSERV